MQNIVKTPEEAGFDTLSNIMTVFRFLRVYPLTWQAFKDRVQQFQQSIESELGIAPFTAIKKLSDKKITDTALKLIPNLPAWKIPAYRNEIRNGCSTQRFKTHI